MDLFADVDEGLQALKDAAPTLIKDVPLLAPLVPFLPLLGIAMNAVSTVQDATGASLPDAVKQVAQTLTPGAPDSAALTQAAPTSVPVTQTASTIAAAASAVAAPTADASQAAVAQAVSQLPGGA